MIIKWVGYQGVRSPGNGSHMCKYIKLSENVIYISLKDNRLFKQKVTKNSLEFKMEVKVKYVTTKG